MTGFVSPWNRRCHRIGGGVLVLAGLLVAFFGLAAEFAWIEYLTGSQYASALREPAYGEILRRSVLYLAATAPVVYVGTGVYAGRYGPLASSVAIPVVVVVDGLANELAPAGWTGPMFFRFVPGGPYVDPYAISYLARCLWLAVVVASVLALVATTVSGSTLWTSRIGTFRRWAWRLGWQPGTVVTVGLVGWWNATETTYFGGPFHDAYFAVFLPIEMPGLLPLAALPWIGLAGIVVRSHGTVLDGFATEARRRGRRLLGGETTTHLLRGGAGGPSYLWSRWYVATTVAVGEDALQIADGCRLDVQTLAADLDPTLREVPWDRIDGVVWDRSRLAVRTTDGTVHEYPCEDPPEELLATVDSRIPAPEASPKRDATTERPHVGKTIGAGKECSSPRE